MKIKYQKHRRAEGLKRKERKKNKEEEQKMKRRGGGVNTLKKVLQTQ